MPAPEVIEPPPQGLIRIHSQNFDDQATRFQTNNSARKLRRMLTTQPIKQVPSIEIMSNSDMWNVTGLKTKQNNYVEHTKERDQWGNLQNYVKILDPTEEKKKIVIAKIKNPTVKI